MSIYSYRGRDRSGGLIQGAIAGVSRDAAVEQLSASGVTVVDLSEHEHLRPADWLRAFGAPGRQAGLDELALFARQLHALLRAGVALVDALAGLAESTQNPAISNAINGVRIELESGRNLSDALGLHPAVFPPLFVNSIRVGEATGRLDTVLQRLASYLERERDTRQRVAGALRYPLFVIAAIVVAVAVINIFVVPQFSRLFANADVALPLATRVLITLSESLHTFWPLLLLVFLTGAIGFTRWIAAVQGRIAWGRIRLRLPAVGPLLQKAELGRFCRSLSMALKAGVPLGEALDVVSQTTANAWFAARVATIRGQVECGESLSRSAAGSGLFPPLVTQMFAVGEEADGLGALLDEVADYYDRELDYDIRHLAQNVEPLLIGVMAALVLLLALGVFLPMWDLATVKFLA